LCRTLSGGVITLVSSLIMFCLFVSEFSAYLPGLAIPQLLHTCTFNQRADAWQFVLRICVSSAGIFLTINTANELSVDTSRGEKLEINVRPAELC